MALLWRLIEKNSEVRELALNRFSGGAEERQARWGALRGLVIQARQYFDAAHLTESISASLLYYYCFMNLAKAELLLWRPETVLEPDSLAIKRLHHGLSFDPTRGLSFEEDFVTVKAGIFSLLYEKRAGRRPEMDRLSILDLLRYVPEVSTDLQDVSLPNSAAGGVRHVVAQWINPAGGNRLRSLIAINLPDLLNSAATVRFLKHNFRPVSMTNGLAFQISDLDLSFHHLMEGHFERDVPGTVWNTDIDEMAHWCWDALTPLLDVRYQETSHHHIHVTPSLAPEVFLPLPSALASYALMYYVSSIVRYKPYNLYSDSNGLERWILKAYIEQAQTRLLLSALNGISESYDLFASMYPQT